jgi:hypothetical protein
MTQRLAIVQISCVKSLRHANPCDLADKVVEDQVWILRFDHAMKTTTLIMIGLALACGGYAQDGKNNPREEAEKLMHRALEAKEAGRIEEAKKLHEQVERMRQEMKKSVEHAGGGKLTGKGPQGERLQHIMQAVEHLNAAGLHEPARDIAHIAQNMRRELEEHMKREQVEAREKEARNHPEMMAHAELEEMRHQMHKMAEQIEQLRAELK